MTILGQRRGGMLTKISNNLLVQGRGGFPRSPNAGIIKGQYHEKNKINILFVRLFSLSVSMAYGDGYQVTTDLWIRAVINTVEKGPIDAVWKLGGEDTTSAGDSVIWGFFYASPSDVTWGSQNNSASGTEPVELIYWVVKGIGMVKGIGQYSIMGRPLTIELIEANLLQSF